MNTVWHDYRASPPRRIYAFLRRTFRRSRKTTNRCIEVAELANDHMPSVHAEPAPDRARRSIKPIGAPQERGLDARRPSRHAPKAIQGRLLAPERIASITSRTWAIVNPWDHWYIFEKRAWCGPTTPQMMRGATRPAIV